MQKEFIAPQNYRGGASGIGVLPVVPKPQLSQHHFGFLPFEPSPIPSLAYEEGVAEKLRAASQRSKIRDLHDLTEIAKRPLNRDLIRSLTVLKLWSSPGPGLDYEQLCMQLRNGDYNVGDLTSLLRKDQKPNLDDMISRVVDGYQFLASLTDAEKVLAKDHVRIRPVNHRRHLWRGREAAADRLARCGVDVIWREGTRARPPGTGRVAGWRSTRGSGAGSFAA